MYSAEALQCLALYRLSFYGSRIVLTPLGHPTGADLDVILEAVGIRRAAADDSFPTPVLDTAALAKRNETVRQKLLLEGAKSWN